ncbi:hypothetical protein GCM10009718_02490 [Isoptericola halotolerans]|uniref:Lambda repressor-like predicted transcriptional regulator n=1 Tax=Isoptericola halotolerans TaxID=300560 RepID=A0ABX2A5D9_9MICO|nr:helix-turn-helix domain-containing protein [Isoptericola halotolerans]NOV96823.1 lambda repressor-like predicted transcriptional regulator [Isoptericola halotolerans]
MTTTQHPEPSYRDFANNVAANISREIEERGMTRAAIARAAGLNPSTFRNHLWNPRLLTTVDIILAARALGITRPSALFPFPAEWAEPVEVR